MYDMPEYLSMGPAGLPDTHQGAAVPRADQRIRALIVTTDERSVKGLTLVPVGTTEDKPLSLGHPGSTGHRLDLPEDTRLVGVFGTYTADKAKTHLATLGIVLDSGKVYLWHKARLTDISVPFGMRWPETGFRFLVPSGYGFCGLVGSWDDTTLTSLGVAARRREPTPNPFVVGTGEMWRIFKEDVADKQDYRVCFRNTLHGTLAMLIRKNGRFMPNLEATEGTPLPEVGPPPEPIPDHLLARYMTQEFYMDPARKCLTSLLGHRQISLWESAPVRLSGAYRGQGQTPPWHQTPGETDPDSGSWGAEEEGP